MLANRLQELLFRRKLSQKKVANDLGLSPQRFNFYVTGRREPDHTTLLQLANYFDVSVDYLLGRSDEDISPRANNIRSARIAAGFSQKQVALELGVSPPTVSEWEGGKKNPLVQNLQMMADMFNVSVDYLLGRSDSPGMPKKDPIPEDEIDSRVEQLPEEVQQLIQICKGRPELTSALLTLARQIKSAPTPQE